MISDRPEAQNVETTVSAPSSPAEVFFRKAYLVQNMCVHPDDTVQFAGVGDRGVCIDFKSIPWDHKQRWWRSPSVCCTATIRCHLPRRSLALYDALWQGRLPDDFTPADIYFPAREDTLSDPVFRHGRVPDFLSTAMDSIEAELESAVARAIGLVRWRCNRTGPVDLPALGGVEWSMNGVAWRLDLRRPTLTSAAFGPDLVMTDGRRADIERLLASGEHEPIQQSLLREAESLLENNPRSALAIGATAAEVAIKVLVSTLAPQTSWLIQNLPSPPIAKILEEYAPSFLPTGSPAFAPKLIKGLKAAVTLRNELVHGARTAVEPNRVSAAFEVFRDVVWLCDYFCGIPWAVNRVSRATLAEMKLAPSVDTSGWFVD